MAGPSTASWKKLQKKSTPQAPQASTSDTSSQEFGRRDEPPFENIPPAPPELLARLAQRPETGIQALKLGKKAVAPGQEMVSDPSQASAGAWFPPARRFSSLDGTIQEHFSRTGTAQESQDPSGRDPYYQDSWQERTLSNASTPHDDNDMEVLKPPTRPWLKEEGRDSEQTERR